ncbi:cytochrome b5 [Trypanosoma theileri]|uniref:Cytochrome b5 n=1 Tax=Trypanosoma theileri TaxID=67003 RepID=A0A1X0P0V0_9TRYP|nr:cytochrome b5 [Trypanosoma theileri]ORC90149.1 cytochrome b5 [Trypanosoma theileri]
MFESLVRFLGFGRKWPTFTLDEVREHNDSSSLWIVAGNSVYDVTSIMNSHPGGANALLRRGGGVKDCTEDYYYHSCATRRTWELYKIGELAPGESRRLKSGEVSWTTTSTEAEEDENGDREAKRSARDVSPVSHACEMGNCDVTGDCCLTSTVETHGSTSEPVPGHRCLECLHRQPMRRAVPPLPL